MISHHETYLSPFSTQELFDLIVDIEKYPDFLPWCTKAKILERLEQNVMIAELFIKVAYISEHYTSRVETIPPIKTNDPCSIKTSLISGPFTRLDSSWNLQFDQELKKTRIDFLIEFSFSSKILQAMIGNIFEQATAKMVRAFEERAYQLHPNA